MGLWEQAHAQRHQVAEQRRIDAEQQRAHDERVAAQQAAVAGFVAAMQRLSIAPQRHRFWCESNRTYSWRSVEGWNAQAPGSRCEHGGVVVSPDGRVYNMCTHVSEYVSKRAQRMPLDLSELQFRSRFGYAMPEGSLTDVLRTGLAHALLASE